jgi:hypothetical protein
MSLIFNDITELVYIIPTAAGTDPQEILPFIQEAESWLQDELLGQTLITHIRDLADDTEIKKTAKTVIALHAYQAAIPFQDLIQTPNGFAVVSNKNQAPASKERVERLLNQTKKRLTTTIDTLLLLALNGDTPRTLWAASPEVFQKNTGTLFITTAELQRNTAQPEATFQDLISSRTTQLSVQTQIAQHISVTYTEELIRKRQTNTLTNHDQIIFHTIQTIAGLIIQKAKHYHIMENLLNYMDRHAAELPLWTASPQYRIRISRKYENKEHHPTFFFGG